MITRIVLACITAATVVSCATARPTEDVRRWNPALAEANAERDIRARNIRFAYVGGRASEAPGLPDEGDIWLYVGRHYPKLEVGPQGCDQDQYFDERIDYATRYNRRMWSYVAKHR